MRQGGETEEEVGAIKDGVGEVGELEATPEVVDSPVLTSTTPTWGVSDVGAPTSETSVRRCPQSAPALIVILPAMWTRTKERTRRGIRHLLRGAEIFLAPEEK